MTFHEEQADPHDPRPARAASQSIAWRALEDIVHCDPAGRGLASYRKQGRALDDGQLRGAAQELAERATAVGIITGFPVMTPRGVAAETDGPPGALYLARALTALGIDVSLIVDRFALGPLEVGCEQLKLDPRMIVEFPSPHDALTAGAAAASPEALTASIERWIDQHLLRDAAPRWTHLVAIERPGPSHTLASLAAQTRGGEVAPLEHFATEVPPDHRDVAHNMRGEVIDGYTGPIHRVFDCITQRKLPVTSIGIGDGGNEIGMGHFAWEDIVAAVGGPLAARLVCRVVTDFALIGGVSNWAAYALALAVARLRDQHVGREWTVEAQGELVSALVAASNVVDGVTRRREATVDGLPLAVYLEPLAAMRRLLGY